MLLSAGAVLLVSAGRMSGAENHLAMESLAFQNYLLVLG